MLVNISMQFYEDINGLKVIFVTETATDKVRRGITKNIYPRVIVLALYTSSNVG